jgi:hypothetical protein
VLSGDYSGFFFRDRCRTGTIIPPD